MIEILQDRGYETSSYPKKTWEEFLPIYETEEEEDVKQSLEMKVSKSLPKKRTETTTVLWPIEEKLGDNIVGILQRSMGLNDNWIVESTISAPQKAIVIVENGVTPMAKGTLKTLSKRGIKIDVYSLQESVINIMKSCLVPEHKIVSRKEAKELMQEYGVTKKGLPEIKITDATMRHLSPNKGDVIRIKRPSETQPGEFTITYRVVK